MRSNTKILKQTSSLRFSSIVISMIVFAVAGVAVQAQQDRLQSSDLYRFHDVAQAAISPDGAKIAYTVLNYDKPGRPYPQLWIVDTNEGNPCVLAPRIRFPRARYGRRTGDGSRTSAK